MTKYQQLRLESDTLHIVLRLLAKEQIQELIAKIPDSYAKELLQKHLETREIL